MKPVLSSFLLIIFQAALLLAQPQPSLTSSEIVQALHKLNTVGSVLYIAAHPDDENTRLLAWLSSEKKLRTGYLSITRGDGGQNLIGKEQGELLGLIRTQELLAARRTDGAEQFFTRANDFGYSKNPEETFAFWNKDSVLADVVWVIRTFRPDVIISRFPTTGEGGHGHHTASAILAMEAFDAAADPGRFKEQLNMVSTWKVKRLFWNAFNPANAAAVPPGHIKMDIGAFNPLLGKGYGEIAAESRSMHKSQGFGAAKIRGEIIEYFKWLKGDSAKEDVFQGMDFSWKRVPGAEKIEEAIAACIGSFDHRRPAGSVPGLANIYSLLSSLPENDPMIRHWKIKKLRETEDLILACSGLWLEAAAADFTGIPGKKTSYSVQIVARNYFFPAALKKITWLNGSDSITDLLLQHNKLYSFRHTDTLARGIPYSNPYWLNEPHGTGMFKVKEQKLIGQPENQPELSVTFFVDIAGLQLKLKRKLTYKLTDPVKGEVYRPFEVLPPATVNFSEKVYVFAGGVAKKIPVTIKANAAGVSGKLVVNGPVTEGWAIAYNWEFRLANKGDEVVVDVTVIPGKVGGKLTAALEINGNTYSKSIARIEYDHIPYQFALNEAESGLINIALEKTNTHIGYIPGAGDDIPACLKQVGYTVTVLTEELLAGENLIKYDAIITGIRAFNTSDRLALQHKKLMDYVFAGGNLIVQYNTNSRVGPIKASLGPHPFAISRKRVTDEHAEVRFIRPDHPALNFPNKISAGDFSGWVQERGIYFADEIDKNYDCILSMNDAGEQPLEGGLIIAKHGKGNFVYTGLAFFRELPAGVPGAYRLMANLISLPKNK